jgi:hypothetical protein
MAGGVDRSLDITMEDWSDPPKSSTDLNLQAYVHSFQGADTLAAGSRGVSRNCGIFDHPGLPKAQAKGVHLAELQDLEYQDQAWYDSIPFDLQCWRWNLMASSRRLQNNVPMKIIISQSECLGVLTFISFSYQRGAPDGRRRCGRVGLMEHFC